MGDLCIFIPQVDNVDRRVKLVKLMHFPSSWLIQITISVGHEPAHTKVHRGAGSVCSDVWRLKKNE